MNPTTSLQPRHSSRGGLVLLPPQSTWPALDAIREKHDAQIVRWMPNIPLLFPFKAPEELEECLAAVTEVCAGFGPLQVTLSDVRFSQLESGKGLLFVACEPAEEIARLQAALAARFPEVSRKEAASEPYVPRIVVGQCRTHLVAQRLSLELRQEWQPIPVEIAAVTLVGREHTGPFRVLHEVALGGARN